MREVHGNRAEEIRQQLIQSMLPYGERHGVCGIRLPVLMFQSTPPTRGATDITTEIVIFSGHFNPRPPLGEQQVRAVKGGA